MSQYLHVFAASAEEIPVEEVADIAESAWYGDGQVNVHADESHWLLIDLPGSGRPVVVLRSTDAPTVDALVAEELGERTGITPELAATLHRTRQVISFEIAPDQLDSDAWELLDTVESRLARRLDGLVLAEDGIYDAGLQKLA
ncbi:hypothetical protein ACWEGE_32950 [Amycolatopsis sp. NPDC004747]